MKQQSLDLNRLLGPDSGSEAETKVESEPLLDRRSELPLTWIKGYLTLAQQMALLREVQGYPFESPEIEVYGKRHRIPRSQVWFGDSGCDTKYSGLLVKALPWPKYADRLRQKLKRDFSLESNGVLVNRYVDGKNSMGWHCDNEPEFSAGSDIASITLGATRDFIIRDKVTHEKQTFALQSGDLLIMHWPMQDRWEHALPKRLKVTEPRINYTFRRVIADYFG